MVCLGIIKTKGIVINEANSKENDKILTVLTPDLGKISVLVKGAKKNKSTFLSTCQLLAFSDLVLYKNLGDLYILNSSEIIELFYNIRIDIGTDDAVLLKMFIAGNEAKYFSKPRLRIDNDKVVARFDLLNQLFDSFFLPSIIFI